jgi:hypothetical protein
VGIWFAMGNVNIMKKEVYIWGAGYYGVLTALHLENEGIKIRGFIDKNAKAIKSKLDLPVLELNEIENKNSQIIIAIQNEYAIIEIMDILLLHKFTFEISHLVKKPKKYFEIRKKETLSLIPTLEPLESKKSPKYIVSLTSSGKRLSETAPYTIITLFNQNINPDKIILWVANEDKEEIPQIMEELIKKGLEIRFCEDIKSYKKLIFALEAFPDDYIITADDDIYYPKNWFEQLINEHKKYPKKIICHCAIPTEYAGTLYPPKCFNKDVTNKELFMKLASHADGIWFWAMAITNKEYFGEDNPYVIIENGYCKNLQPVAYEQTLIENTLRNYNCLLNENDRQLNAVIEHYPQIREYLSKIVKDLQTMDLFYLQRRFDIIFKYFYAKWSFVVQTDFPKQIYLSHIFAFNKFYEKSPYKKLPIDFINSFDKLLNSIKNNEFDKNYPIPIHFTGELVNGAHRFVSAMIANREISTTLLDTGNTNIYDYSFFKERGLANEIADFNACLYVPMNPFARMFLLHPVAKLEYDDIIKNILNKYGFIYYEKELHLTYNGYVNLKKMNYARDKKNQWGGTPANDYEGLKKHALASFAGGKNPLRIFVWVCKNEQSVIDAKREIRAIYDIGNYSCHSSDTHEEAIELAQTFFNENSLYYLNNRAYGLTTSKFDEFIENLKQDLISQKIPLQAVCACGSTPMGIFGIRTVRDLDFLCIDDCGYSKTSVIRSPASSHADMSHLYEPCKDEIILNPKYHFYYRGLKFITLDVLLQFKTNRKEKPKDINDCNLIQEFKTNSWNKEPLLTSKKLNGSKTTLIYMANDTRTKGGWAARLSCMLTLYRIAKDNDFNFKINFTKPFNLQDFIIPNKYDWRIDEKDILFSEETTSVSMLSPGIRDLYLETQSCKNRSEFEKFLLDLKGKYNQILCYCDTLDPAHGKWRELFNELFILKEGLKERIDFHRQKIGSEYISVTFRFLGVLDDFNETSNFFIFYTLTRDEQNNLIKMCVENLKVISNMEKGKIILVCSDSIRFRNAVKNIENIYVVDGEVAHTNSNSIDKEALILSFVDFFLISYGQKTYSFAPDLLYPNGFSRIASMLSDVPFKYIQYDMTKPLLKNEDSNIDLRLRNNSVILDYLKNEKTGMFSQQEKEEIIECLTENPFSVFPYRFAKEKVNFEIFHDDDCGMFFVLHKNRKLYFSQNLNKDKVKERYYNLLIEQDYRSPHCYNSNNFEVCQNDIIADLGAAEGIWALDNVETAKFVYIFESNKDRICALHKTFEPYKMKIRIVNKCVSGMTEGNKITIDDFIAENGADISFIKADIDGMEINMLGGMQKLLENKTDLRLLLCTYHQQNEADKLEQILRKKYGFSTELSQGVMLFIHDKLGLQEPYFRKGLIRAKRVLKQEYIQPMRA